MSQPSNITTAPAYALKGFSARRPVLIYRQDRTAEESVAAFWARQSAYNDARAMAIIADHRGTTKTKQFLAAFYGIPAGVLIADGVI